MESLTAKNWRLDGAKGLFFFGTISFLRLAVDDESVDDRCISCIMNVMDVEYCSCTYFTITAFADSCLAVELT